MMGSLWNVLKCGFSLFSDTESAKSSFSSLQNISQNYFVRPPLPGDLSLNMLVTESHKPRLVKSFSQSAVSSSEILEILRWLRKLLISTTVFCLCFFKKKSWNCLTFLSSPISFFIEIWAPRYFSKFKKNFVNFLLSSYQSHLLLIQMSSVMWS